MNAWAVKVYRPALDLRSTRDFQFGPPRIICGYFRQELGYDTHLTYSQIETGYAPTPGHSSRNSGEQFHYNQPGVTAADLSVAMRPEKHLWTCKNTVAHDISRFN